MKSRLFRIGLLFGVVLGAVAGACSKLDTPARFPHRTHLAGLKCGGKDQPACLSCNTCHAPTARDRAHSLPNAELCDRCHTDEKTMVRAVLGVQPERAHGKILFNHDLHLALKDIEGQCIHCHGGVVEANKARLPAMSECLSCHEHEAQWQKGQCTPCHIAGELREIMPETFLRHEGNFMRRHGLLAAQEAQLCQACHTQTQCDDCHDVSQGLSVERRRPEQISRHFVHRADFVTRHGIEARSQSARCASCHEPESCDGCHTARGVSGSLLDPANPHPPGWLGSSDSVRSLHGIEARRDIFSCASCHDQGPATNCIRCHRVGAYGGNPHPGGAWTSSMNPNERMCAYCHE